MLAPYLRSSSLNTLSLCEHKFFIEYNIGLRGEANIAAEKGNVVHKVLEFLAHDRLAEQEKRLSFEDDIFGEVQIKDCKDVDKIIQKVYNHHVETTKWDWGPKDFKDCVKWVNTVLEFNDGEYDPRKRRVVAPERRFDVTIKDKWAAYDFPLPNNERMKGQLVLKGTVDLITDVSSGNEKVFEVVDWKTGRRMDWATDKPKDEAYLQKDIQLLLYHYAVSEIYPEVNSFIFTVFYIKDGGPYTVTFDKSDLANTKKIIRKKYEHIIYSYKPKLNISWKCRFCSFSKGDYKNSGKTPCEFFRKEIVEKGMPNTLLEHANHDGLTSYVGGGRGKNSLVGENNNGQ